MQCFCSCVRSLLRRSLATNSGLWSERISSGTPFHTMTSARALITLAEGPASFGADHQALARVLVDPVEEAYTAAIVRPCAHEVVAPHKVRSCRLPVRYRCFHLSQQVSPDRADIACLVLFALLIPARLFFIGTNQAGHSTVGSTATTRPEQKDSWTQAAVRTVARTQHSSRSRAPSSCCGQASVLGARKLKATLEMLQPDAVWAAASTFGKILSRAGLTSPQEKRKRTTPCSEPFSMVTGSNQLRCMDFTSCFTTGDGKRCDPFAITVAHSRYLIRCQIVSRMDLSQVRAICEAAMREYGVPARIRTDNAHHLRIQGYLGCRNSRSSG